MIIDEKNYIAHYGILRKSGRYPWGSGGTTTTRSKSFLDIVESLHKQGMTEVEIARGFSTKDHPFTTTDLRALKSIASNETRQANINMAERLRTRGFSNGAIAARMGLAGESSVRSLLAPGVQDRVDVLQTVSSMLKEQVDTKGFIDVGSGVENNPHLGISRNKLDTALAVLKEQGYEVHNVQIDTVGGSSNNKTIVKVLAPPGTTYKDIVTNKSAIKTIDEFSDDGGRNFYGIQPPISVSSKRIGVRYAEDGGTEADGVIFVRHGVEDVTLGSARYAQVRVAVDGTHYLKGMAVYKDDMPPGIDLIFNTNKHATGNKLDAMKKLTDDVDNPFGAVVRQLPKLDAHGQPIKDTVRSAMNIVNEEGNWETWSRNLSSQMLSKQSPALAKTQLDMTYEAKKNQLDEITKLSNPAVKRLLLRSLADDSDSSAIHLQAAQLPRQATHVILPINSMKEGEIYAPNYRDGERVVLIRHPHGGTFEIPELTVNNKNPQAKAIIGPNARDAIGIHSSVAERLSGADFDGDTVIVIPQGAKRPVKTSPALAGLKDFDPKAAYPKYPGMKVITPDLKQAEMGKISNLITDMTIRGANNAELARAVRHSMVVIDAEKHELDYKQSAVDNGIANLKERYQSLPGKSGLGASTLISRAGSRIDVPVRKPRSAAEGGPIDKATGKLVFKAEPESFVDREGRVVVKTRRSEKLAETDDARTLSSGTVMEDIYAEHSNKLKNLANQARRAMVNTKSTPYSPSAKTAYASQVASLNAKLSIALRNRPLERQAQVLANATIEAKVRANPDMTSDVRKRIAFQALEEMRTRTGAKKKQIVITQPEWDAIQAGAITNHKLEEILKNADVDTVKKLATPRVNTVMTDVKLARAKTMLASGYTQSQVADQLGVALSTLTSSIQVGG